MALEAYVPSQATFDGRPLDPPFMFVLHDADADQPTGSLTVSNGPAVGDRGPLAIVGRREGQTWRVELEQIEVRRATPAGFEFDVCGAVRRELLSEGGESAEPDDDAFEQKSTSGDGA